MGFFFWFVWNFLSGFSLGPGRPPWPSRVRGGRHEGPQDASGSLRRLQEAPGGLQARAAFLAVAGARRAPRGAAGGLRKPREAPGGPRKPQETHAHLQKLAT